jgi:NitT/TauT family transport system substrate-binding protein
MKNIVRALSLAGLCLAATTAAEAVAATRIKVGVCVSWPGYSMYHLARVQGLAPGYEIETTILEDPLGGHSMLAAGQLDVYVCTIDYTPVAIEQGLPELLVAATNPSYGVDQVVLAPGIEPADLVGRKVAAPQAYIGSLVVGYWLSLQGIAPDQVEVANLNADEAVGPMLSGDLAAAYMYEPWVSKLLEAMPGARSVANTAQPEFLATGMFSDAIYMNRDFVRDRRADAAAMLKARWEAVGWWSRNTAEANRIIAEYLDWPIEDVEAVVGTTGKYAEGAST